MSTRPSDWTDEERDAFAGLEGQLDAMSARYREAPPVDALLAQLEQVDVADATLDAVTEARLLRRVRAAATPPPRAHWRRSLGIALAAAAVGLVAVRVTQRPATGPADVAVTVPPAAVDLPTSPAPAPEYLVPFDKAEVRLSLGALTWRGAGQPSAGGLVTDLKPGIDAYRSGDYATAERALAPLAARYPDAVEVHFYLGVTQLLRDRPAAAVAALERAVDLGDQTFAADAAWYLAVAHQRAGEVEAARSELQQICAAGEGHATQACAAVEHLGVAREQTPGTR